MVSPELKGIFDIPQSPPKANEAPEGTNENPVFIPQVTTVQFDDFLGWILKPGWRPYAANEHRQEEKWNVQEAIAHTKEILEGMPIRATRRLQLARMFSLHDWVLAAVQSLMEVDLMNLERSHIKELNLTTFSILANVREARWNYRRSVAHVAPTLHDDPDHNCTNHARCKAVWKEAWWRHVAKKLLHSVNSIGVATVPDFVRSLTIDGMSWSCKYDAMDGWVSREEEMITAATQAIIEYNESLP
ncbi:hypothetical protein C8R45DRAFT_1099638 [Mycena sanguinolenta]|nr:hypothetical protein C8R45DRAFT_1099638 [Mycena sanguinolenta]